MGDTNRAIQHNSRVKTPTGKTGTVQFVEQGDDVIAVRLDGEWELRAFQESDLTLIED